MWRFLCYISLFRCSNEPSTYWRVPCQRFHWQVQIQICSQNIGLENFNSVNELKITSLGAPVNTDFIYFSIFYYSFIEDFKTVEFRDKTMSWNICWARRCRPLFEGKKTVDKWVNITSRAVFKRLSKTPQKNNFHFQLTVNRWNSRSNLLVCKNQWRAKVDPIMSHYFEKRDTNQNQF